jgi:hypothetical protein
MSRLEDRLRDAYQDAAGTVTPGSVRGLEERIARRARPGRRRGSRASRWGRVLAPLAAAAAVVAIVVLTAVALLPSPNPSPKPSPGQRGHGRVATAEPKFLVTISQGNSPALQVRNVATGGFVAQVSLPAPKMPPGIGASVTVATADGRHYLVAIYGNACRSRLYQFQLNDRGQPSAVTTFAALPTVSAELSNLAISANGQMIGYSTIDYCTTAVSQPQDLAVTNVRTGQTTRWTAPGTGNNGAIVSVSLTADGGELCYASQDGPSVVRVIPTSAAPGSAADRGRTVARAAQFGRSDWVLCAVITPDGKAVYFTTYPESSLNGWSGQVRELDLATGRSRIVYAPAGLPGAVTADPLVRHLLLQIEVKAKPSLSPPPPKLASLDLATGKITYLPNGWLGRMLMSVIRW